MKEREKNERLDVVVITGATAGVGRAVVREFAKRGAQIGLIARGIEGLEATKKEVEELGGKAIICQADVANPKEIEDAADKIENLLGPIDIWINNAMTSVFSPISKMTPEEYLRVTEVTYLGQVYGTLAVLRRMKVRSKGKIIFIGSALAYRGIPLQSAYCGAKHAIAGFYDSLRSELLHEQSNIKTTIIHLPAMNTPQFNWVKNRLPHKPKPMGKIFQPEVAAKAIVYASYHDKREMHVGLPTEEAIWGNKLLPGFMDKWMAKLGYKGQQTDEPKDVKAKENVWEPVQGDFGAHGTFDKDAYSFSPQEWLVTHKKKVGITLAGLAFGAFVYYKVKKYSLEETVD